MIISDIPLGGVPYFIYTFLLNYTNLFHYKTLISKGLVIYSFDLIFSFVDDTFSAPPQFAVPYSIETAIFFSCIVSLMQ